MKLREKLRNHSTASVLLVEADADRRERIGRWLTAEGYEVFTCPGPRSPDYTCLGGRGLNCPLPAAADVVVLDMWLASDTALRGTPGWQLLDYYTSRGLPVVAVADPDDPIFLNHDNRVMTVGRPTDRRELLAAVKTFSGRKR